MDCTTPGFPVHHNSQSLLKHMSIESVMPSNHLILCHPFLLPSIFSSIRIFSNESVLYIRWPKYWNLSFSISPSNEYSGRISFRMDWLDLFAFSGTLKSLLQHHSWKALILQCSAFFMVQLSHPYVTTGKTIALNRWTFVGIVMPLLFNMLSRLVVSDKCGPLEKGMANHFSILALRITWTVWKGYSPWSCKWVVLNWATDMYLT